MGREKIGLGRLGERLALEFLIERGYKILEINYRNLFGEVDVVGKIKGVVVFVEIKTRSTSSLGPPFISVTPLKQRHIIKTALLYLKMRDLIHSNWRVDVVSVKLNSDYGVEYIDLIENVVENDGY
ncbi:MAG: hypothetical protein A2987_02285 [Omnitrophica bacterium RIFCSPLOWO2_01_FULL_45_10]|nr:MAG: hypothetical protein A2987_02285 [Omnitrophica bacterium RIFCSPLOWO2_01_FULL_45_10]